MCSRRRADSASLIGGRQQRKKARKPKIQEARRTGEQSVSLMICSWCFFLGSLVRGLVAAGAKSRLFYFSVCCCCCCCFGVRGCVSGRGICDVCAQSPGRQPPSIPFLFRSSRFPFYQPFLSLLPHTRNASGRRWRPLVVFLFCSIFHTRTPRPPLPPPVVNIGGVPSSSSFSSFRVPNPLSTILVCDL